MKKIDPQKFRSPSVVFAAYILISSLLIMGFRLIFPGEAPPLPNFARNWRLLRGLLDTLAFFPALALSAMTIPFGMIPKSGELYGSFSPKSFARLDGPVTIAICAAALYALVFLLAQPIARDHEEDMRFKAELYHLAKERAQTHRDTGEWLAASQFIEMAETVWNNSPELTALKNETAIHLEEDYFSAAEEREEIRDKLKAEPRNAALAGIPGQKQPVNAAEAIAQGEAAFAEERFYDAHWLATLGERLARQGSIEAANAARLAGRAWNRIETLEPDSRERERRSLYWLKQSGYTAMVSGDWIRAFYIFQELVKKTPDDPDAKNFLTASEKGTRETSFFIDEMEMSLRQNLAGALFSLPAETRSGAQGRAVLRFSGLSTEADYAYGTGFEYLSVDSAARPLIRLNAPYVKLLPVTLDGRRQVLVLTRALDRRDENRRWEAEWNPDHTPESPPELASTPLLLDVSYEDFLILFRMRRGLSNLSMGELFAASKTLGNAGYIPQTFETEILNRLGAVFFFLPMTIVALIAGWRYRARNRPRYFFVLMLAVLPCVFHGLIQGCQAVLNNTGVWLTLSVGFPWALVICFAATAISLVLALILLVAQRDN